MNEKSEKQARTECSTCRHHCETLCRPVEPWPLWTLQGLKDVEQLSVLDVAVGHGMYGIECARRHKGLAVTALGSLPVLQQVISVRARDLACIIAEGSGERLLSL